MKLVTYRLDQSEARLGVLKESLLIDVQQFGERVNLNLSSSMQDFIELGPIAVETLDTALEESVAKDLVGISVPFENAKILAPIPRPKKNIFGIGLNYKDHIGEASKALDTPSGLPK